MILELDGVKVNNRNGSYGGLAGSKEGIDINGEPWIVKYPKSTEGMRGDLAPYTSAPLSEYVGSHVYEILGVPVHKTELGIRNGFLVVACKDFCKISKSLREFREVKNTYNSELNRLLSVSLEETGEDRLVRLEDMVLHFQYNPVLVNMPEVSERFWTQMIIDVLINNNDRNNGNWGVIYEEDSFKLAPVYDNGSSFYNKLPDERLVQKLDPIQLKQCVNSARTIYSLDNKPLFATQIVNIPYTEFWQTVAKIVPQIQSRMSDIQEFVKNTPEEYKGIEVCSSIKKDFYCQSMQACLEQVLVPLYEAYASAAH